MVDIDPMATQRDDRSHLVAELSAVGFEDLHEIGSGGFGVVFRGRQPELDRTVAIKLLTARPDPDNVERFLREQRAMGRLSGHPNIVTVYGVGTTASGQPYIVMEYHRRNSLEVRIRTQGHCVGRTHSKSASRLPALWRPRIGWACCTGTSSRPISCSPITVSRN